MSNNKELIKNAIVDHQKGDHWFPPTEFDGLPSRSQPKPRPDGRIKVAMGLRAQGIFEYVERLKQAGCGWDQIGKAVGWIGFALFERYYYDIYKDACEEIGVAIGSVNQGKREGNYYYDIKNKKIFKSETTDSLDYNPLRKEILNVSIRVQNEEKFASANMNRDWVMCDDQKTVSENLVFHVTMKKDDEEKLLKAMELKDLMVDVFDLQDQGYQRTTQIYYDLVETEDSIKKVISREGLEFFMALGLKDSMTK